MAESQTYRVETIYEVTDKASRHLGEIEKSAKKAAETTSTLKNLLIGIGSSALIVKGFGVLKHATLGLNAQLEQTRVRLGGLTSMYTGVTLEKSFERAAVSMKRFHEMSWQSGANVEAIAEAARALTGPLLQAGMSITQIEKTSHQAVKAAEAYGVSESELTSGIIRSIITGNVKKDKTLQHLLGQKEIGVSSGKFEEMSMKKRAETLQKALSTATLESAADAVGSTFTGTIDDLKSHMDKLLTTAGEPLFKAATQELIKIQKWVENNRHKLEEMGKTFGEGMVKGFGMIKDAVSFIARHAETLITIGKVWAAIKVGQALGGTLGGAAGSAAGGASSFLSWFAAPKAAKDSIDPFTGEYSYTPGTKGGRGRQAVGGFSGAMSNAPLLGQSLAAGLAIGTFVNNITGLSSKLAGVVESHGEMLDVTDRTTKKFYELTRSMDAMDAAVKRAAGEGKTGVAGTSAMTNLKGVADMYANQAQLLRDFQRESGRSVSGPMDFGRQQSKLGGIREAMLKAGLTPAEIDAVKFNKDAPHQLASQLESKAAGLRSRYNQATMSGEGAYNYLVNQLTETQKATLDQAKAQTNLMAYVNQNLSKGLPLDNKAMLDIIRAATDDPLDNPFKNQAKPFEQNVTINVAQMTSKDPNRWLAEIDDMVSRRTRAKTRAKRAWKSTPQ